MGFFDESEGKKKKKTGKKKERTYTLREIKEIVEIFGLKPKRVKRKDVEPEGELE